uniref:Uncharacterized protein n=1 Tax=Candidatus Kentrum sp. SD TaxID=2126332 RepID=A0A451BSN3_9GAMM|nr:MAG: hypothetical protein BECKSD772D_GA0070982_13081 [Candidatus Kentron sp. SD]
MKQIITLMQLRGVGPQSVWAAGIVGSVSNGATNRQQDVNDWFNPTCAGPYLYRTTCSNSPGGGVCSQRRRATDGDGGARQVESGRCRVSALDGCQVPIWTEALTAHSALVAQNIRLFALHVTGVWRCRLDKMADDADR